MKTGRTAAYMGGADSDLPQDGEPEPQLDRDTEAGPAGHDAGTVPASQPWPPHHRIGSCEIVQLLRAGDAGNLYRAWDHALARPVILEEFLPPALAHRDRLGNMRPSLPAAAPMLERAGRLFIEEARALAKAEHPALARVLHLIEGHGTAFRVLPGYAGRPLADLLAEGEAPQDEAALRRLLDDLLGALEAWHAVAGAYGNVSAAQVMWLDSGHALLLGPDAASHTPLGGGAAAAAAAAAQPRAAGDGVGDTISRAAAAGLFGGATGRKGAGLGGSQGGQGDGNGRGSSNNNGSSPDMAADLQALARLVRDCMLGPGTVVPPGVPLPDALQRARSESGLPLPHYSAALMQTLDAALSADALRRPAHAAQFRQWLQRGPDGFKAPAEAGTASLPIPPQPPVAMRQTAAVLPPPSVAMPKAAAAPPPSVTAAAPQPVPAPMAAPTVAPPPPSASTQMPTLTPRPTPTPALPKARNADAPGNKSAAGTLDDDSEVDAVTSALIRSVVDAIPDRPPRPPHRGGDPATAPSTATAATHSAMDPMPATLRGAADPVSTLARGATDSAAAPRGAASSAPAPAAGGLIEPDFGAWPYNTVLGDVHDDFQPDGPASAGVMDSVPPGATAAPGAASPRRTRQRLAYAAVALLALLVIGFGVVQALAPQRSLLAGIGLPRDAGQAMDAPVSPPGGQPATPPGTQPGLPARTSAGTSAGTAAEAQQAAQPDATSTAQPGAPVSPPQAGQPDAATAQPAPPQPQAQAQTQAQAAPVPSTPAPTAPAPTTAAPAAGPSEPNAQPGPAPDTRGAEPRSAAPATRDVRGQQQQPRAAPASPPLVAAATSPRQQCGDRTEFSLYRCMQQQCAQGRWRDHGQCVQLRQTDQVPG